MGKRSPVEISSRQTFGHVLLVPLLLLFLLLLSYVNFRRVVDATEMRRRSYQILLETHDLLSSLINMETGVRGFAATNNESFLEPYHQGRQDFVVAFRTASQLIPHETELQKNLSLLQQSEMRWRATQEDIISMRRRTPKDEQVIIAFQKSSVERKRMMDAMRVLIANIESTERTRLQQKTVQVESLRVLTAATIFGGGLLSVVMAAYLAMMVARAMRDLRASNSALQSEINERLRTEIALGESQRRFSAIFNNTFQFTGLLLPDGMLLEANQTALDFGGVQRQDVVGKPFWQTHWWTISEDTQNQLQEAIAKAAQGEFVRYEVEVLGQANSTAVIDFSLKPVMDENGEVVLLIPEGRNITEQKETLRQLNEVQGRWQSVFESSRYAIVYASTDINYRDFNDAYCYLTGYSRDELMHLHFKDITPPEYHQMEDEIVAQILLTGEPKTYEKEYIRKDGSRVFIEHTAFLVRNEGRPSGIAAIMNDITDRKRAEEALRQSEQRFRAIFDNAFQFTGLLSPEGVLLESNQTGRDFAGITRDEVVGLPFWETRWWAVSDEVQQQLRASIQKAAQGEFIRYETRVCGAGDSHAIIDFSIKPIFDDNANVVLLIAEGRDITEQKETQQALVELHDRFGLVIQGTNDGIWDWDLRTNEVYYSPRWKEMLGYHDDEIENHIEQWKKLVHPDDLQFSLNTIETYLRGENESYQLEHRIRHKDGSYRWMLARGVALRDANGTAYRLAGSNQDLTERITFEKALAESQRTLATLMSNLPGMAYRCLNQPNWPLTFVSDGCQQLTGYSPQELEIGGNLTYADLIHPDDRDMVWEIVQEGIETCKPYEMIYRLCLRNGQEKWVWEQGQGIWNEFGELEALEGLVLDVTEQKHAEDALAKSLEDLQRSNRELEAFAYVASHDLQEPLRAVSGCVQILQRRYVSQLDERAEELMRHAVEGSQRMQNLINDLLAYSRVGTRGKPMEPTDCNRVLDSVLRTLRLSIQESGAQIVHQNLPHVMADANQLEQVFQNLLSNAMKFRGDKLPEIEIGAERHAGEWVFHVRDNGIGIAPEYAERIFVMFQRLHTRTEYPGTGIGLAICKKIIERHGGRIWVESGEGGTTFYFSIPNSLPAVMDKGTNKGEVFDD